MIVEFVRLSEIHLEMVRNWRNSPEVSKYMYTDQHISEQDQVNWFEKVKNDSTKAYWVIKMDDKYVGVVNLYDINDLNKRCYWAYYLADPSVRGKGLGRLIELNILNYIFEILGLNKLCCEVFSSNEIVVKIHQKYGSKIEGEFRKHVYKEGDFRDIICMGILKEEWEEVKKKFKFEIIKIE